MNTIQLEIGCSQISKITPEHYTGFTPKLGVVLEDVNPEDLLDIVLDASSILDLSNFVDKLKDNFGYSDILDQIDYNILKEYVESKTSIYS